MANVGALTTDRWNATPPSQYPLLRPCSERQRRRVAVMNDASDIRREWLRSAFLTRPEKNRTTPTAWRHIAPHRTAPDPRLLLPEGKVHVHGRAELTDGLLEVLAGHPILGDASYLPCRETIQKAQTIGLMHRHRRR